MSDVKFDLQEALAESIIKGTGLPIKIAYLAPDNSIGLVPEQGSHKISTDFSGREYWVYNYAITERGKSARDIKNDLFKISMYLDDLEQGLQGFRGAAFRQRREISDDDSAAVGGD